MLIFNIEKLCSPVPLESKVRHKTKPPPLFREWRLKADSTSGRSDACHLFTPLREKQDRPEVDPTLLEHEASDQRTHVVIELFHGFSDALVNKRALII